MTGFPYRIARVQRAHGLQGEVFLRLLRPRRDRPLDRVRISPPAEVALTDEHEHETPFSLEAVRFVDPTRLVATFTGVADRTAAEALSGRYLDAHPDTLPDILVDEADRAFGAEVVDADTDAVLGTVTDIRDNGAQALLEVERESGEAVLVPYVDAFVRSLEREGDTRILRVATIPGLFDPD